MGKSTLWVTTHTMLYDALALQQYITCRQHQHHSVSTILSWQWHHYLRLLKPFVSQLCHYALISSLATCNGLPLYTQSLHTAYLLSMSTTKFDFYDPYWFIQHLHCLLYSCDLLCMMLVSALYFSQQFQSCVSAAQIFRLINKQSKCNLWNERAACT